jgi:hypothetical protein
VLFAFPLPRRLPSCDFPHLLCGSFSPTFPPPSPLPLHLLGDVYGGSGRRQKKRSTLQAKQKEKDDGDEWWWWGSGNQEYKINEQQQTTPYELIITPRHSSRRRRRPAQRWSAPSCLLSLLRCVVMLHPPHYYRTYTHTEQKNNPASKNKKHTSLPGFCSLRVGCCLLPHPPLCGLLFAYRERELTLLPRLLEYIDEPIAVDPAAELACDTDSEYTLLASVECESPL